MADEWIEIPVLIHGVDPSINPRDHSRSYAKIINLINEELKKKDKKQLTEKPIAIEWGWDSRKSNENDKFLSEAQRIIYKKVDNSINNKSFYFLEKVLEKIYTKLRKEFLFGAGDLFYYISQDGETAVRNNVFNQISKEIMKIKNKKISLTFITHSAGTIVMHDLLYHIFGRKTNSPIKSINEIRKLAKDGNLRINKLFTFGSPITSASLRSDALMINTIKRNKLNPEHLGLRKKDNLQNPRWINFWDKDDILSFPLEFSYKKIDREKVVQDHIINLKGFLFWKVHAGYWKSREMARKIAEVL